MLMVVAGGQDDYRAELNNILRKKTAASCVKTSPKKMLICVMGLSDPVILFVRAYLPMRAGAACIRGAVCVIREQQQT